MTDRPSSRSRPTPAFAATMILLFLGVCPLPGRIPRLVRQSARSPEIDRETASGYYETLVSGRSESRRDDLARTLSGGPGERVDFQESGVARPNPRDFLLFELLPRQDRRLFGRRFSTNAFAMRDRPYPLKKPQDAFRVVLLGSSIDMGWGVGTDETYENLLEDWLNAHAAKRGDRRRFEILNFAVAAYGPSQRLETYRRRASKFEPDAVIYSATMLDPRLTEIHLRGLLRNRVDPKYDFLRRVPSDAGVTEDDLRKDVWGSLRRRDEVKRKLRPFQWPIARSAVSELATACRDENRALLYLVIPRAGRLDAPGARAEAVARHLEIAAATGVPAIDLSNAFDARDAVDLQVAATDDHPNALGHKVLFRALARAIVDNPKLYALFFPDRRSEPAATPADPSSAKEP